MSDDAVTSPPTVTDDEAELRRRRRGTAAAETTRKAPSAPWPLVALVGWLVPGGGFFLIGQRWRGLWGGGAVIALFVLGLLIGGIRVIDVPGYRDAQRIVVNAQGQRLPDNYQVRPGEPTGWFLTKSPFAAVVDKPWYIGQFLAGPINLAASYASLQAAQTYPKPTARLGEIGTLYCAVAGMMNLVLLLDAAARAMDKK